VRGCNDFCRWKEEAGRDGQCDRNTGASVIERNASEEDTVRGSTPTYLVMIFYLACARSQAAWWGSRFNVSKSTSPDSRYFVCLFARFPNAVARTRTYSARVTPASCLCKRAFPSPRLVSPPFVQPCTPLCRRMRNCVHGCILALLLTLARPQRARTASPLRPSDFEKARHTEETPTGNRNSDDRVRGWLASAYKEPAGSLSHLFRGIAGCPLRVR
jgi:hypothetical protein